MNITSLPPIRKHRTARLLMVAVAALCTLPMLVMGASPASAAATIPVHDLKTQILPPEHAFVRLDTSRDVPASAVTDVQGFKVVHGTSPDILGDADSIYYYPQSKDASLMLRAAGEIIDPATGQSRPLWARYTVHDSYRERLVWAPVGTGHFSFGGYLTRTGPSNADIHPNPRDTWSDVTVTLIDSATGQPLSSTMRGSTGFTDLDGPDGPEEGRYEGMELLAGFDGAYVRSDAHLEQYGTNGWRGKTDANYDDFGTVHAFQHYLGATFLGSTLRVKHLNGKETAFQTDFSPFNSTIPYRLHYDRNASDAVGNTPNNTGTPNDMDTTTVMHGCYAYYPADANITLATGTKDADCWDASQLTRPHHTFMGWSRDKDATEPEATIVMPKHDETVYAIWKKNPTFTYDADKPADYTGTMPAVPDTREIPYDTAASNVSDWKAGDMGLLRGYRFDGWRTARDDASAAYDFAAHVTQDTTVYGSWTPLTINLHYDANGGNGSHDPQNTRWDTTVTIPSDVNKPFSRDEFTLKEWNTKPDGSGTAYQPGGKVPMVDKDVILYAQWAPLVTMMPATGSTTLGWAIGAGTLLLLGAIASAVALMQCRRTRLTPHGHRD